MGLFFCYKPREVYRMKIKVDGGIAMLPSRFPESIKVVDSLKGQVETLYIKWQGDNPPVFPSWCVVSWGENNGDIGKFPASHNDVVTLDDDTIYPEGYVQDFLLAARKYPGHILTHHGKNWVGPTNYYWGEVSNVVRALYENRLEIPISAPGTGVSYYPAEIYSRMKAEMAQEWNCADIMVGAWAKKAGVPIISVKHRAHYFRYLHPKDTIWDQSLTRDMTSLWNKYMA
jgi:hypothetical protein